jgi:hypothetical protein
MNPETGVSIKNRNPALLDCSGSIEQIHERELLRNGLLPSGPR